MIQKLSENYLHEAFVQYQREKEMEEAVEDRRVAKLNTLPCPFKRPIYRRADYGGL